MIYAEKLPVPTFRPGEFFGIKKSLTERTSVRDEYSYNIRGATLFYGIATVLFAGYLHIPGN